MACAVTVRNHSERTLLGMFAVLQNGLTADQMQQATCKYTISISAEINNAPNTKLSNRVSKDTFSRGLSRVRRKAQHGS